MQPSLRWGLFALATSLILNGCTSGPETSPPFTPDAAMHTDASEVSEADDGMHTETPHRDSFETGCTDGFDSGLDTPVRSFQTVDEGRYCEVVIVFLQEDGSVLADVYNSLLFGSCPQALWDELDANAIKDEFPGSLFAVLNGPRYFLMQHLLNSPAETNAAQTHDFGSIRMIKAATITTDLNGRMSYRPTTINRNNTWRFSSGSRVHELIDNEGAVYIMQSFAQIVDENLNTDDLEVLGDRLSLPSGWHYRSRRLSSDLDVQAEGTATVIQDDFQNTYQLRRDCRITD